MQADLSVIQAAYRNSARLRIHVSEVADLFAEELSHSLHRVLLSLGSEYKEPFWLDLLSSLKKYRYTLAVSVLPFNHPILFPKSTIQMMKDKSRNIISRKPQLETEFERLTEALEMLAEYDETPLLNRILDLHSQTPGRDAVLISHKQHHTVTIELLSSRAQSDLTVVTEQQLRQLKHYDRLFVTGPATWYKPHVIGTPRAPRIDVVRFNWLQDPIKIESEFVHPLFKPARSLNITPALRTTTVSDGVKISQEEAIYEIDWKGFVSSYLQARDSSDEEVLAHCIRLEGDNVVFLEKEAQIFVLKPYDTGDKRIQRIAFAELQDGDYLILRTAGGGDQISELASRNLGKRESHIRECQRNWKDKLKQFELRNGMDRTIKSLKQEGATRTATPVNVRNWRESRTIKPRNIADFIAILIVCGLEKDQDQYLKAAKQLASAHISAGQEIRKRLIAQLRSANLQLLEDVGSLEIELSVGGGAMAVCRVTAISPDTMEVASSRLGQRLPLDS
jgi:hypothetical protein